MAPPRILIVDDEMDMRIFMSTLFKTNGYRAVAKKNGREGLQEVRSRRPDLITLDIMMPGEGGVHMYRHLKTDAELKTIPVIMLSAVSQNAFQHYINMLSARLGEPIPAPDAYVEKPPSMKTLLALVRKLLGS